MGGWKLTVRHGSEVESRRFEDLEAAVAELERQAREFASEPPLEDVSMIRDWSSEDRTNARLQVSRGLLRGPAGGVDVRGDGRIVPFRGRALRRELGPTGGSVFDAVREALQ